MTTTFVPMYHPALPGTPHVLAPEEAHAAYVAKGWLDVDGSTPAPEDIYLTPGVGDLRYAKTNDIGDPTTLTGAALRAAFPPKWAPSTFYAATTVVLNPSNQLVTANADFTSSSSYDSTKWTLVKTLTAMMNDRSVTENKLSVPAEGSNGQVLSYDSTQAGQMKWAPVTVPPASNTIPGLIADDATQATATANLTTLLAWVAAPTASAVSFVTPGVYSFYGDIDFTNAASPIRELFIGRGVTLQQTKLSGTTSSVSAYGPRFRGSVGSAVAFTADTARFATTVTLADVTGIVGETATFAITPGTMLYLYSDDNIHSGGKFRNAAMRRVVSVSGSTVTLDAPLFRAFTVANGASARIVTPHPSVLVHGPGIIQHSDPGSCHTFYNSLLRFDWCTDVIVRDVHVTKGAGVGVDLINVWGGQIDAHVSYLPSNDTLPWESGNTSQDFHYGYGVFAGGGTRNVKIGGTAHHVRHGFTTGNAIDVYGQSGGSNYGDPEFIEVAMNVWDTWHQAIDTHEAGHDIELWLMADGPGTFDDATQQGQQILCNVRSVNTTVRGRGQGGVIAGVIFDASTLQNPAEGVFALKDCTLIGPKTDAIRVVSGTGTKFRMHDVRVIGSPLALRVKGAPAPDIEGRRVTFDASGLASTTSAMLIENAVAPGRIDLRDLDVVGYSAEITYGTGGSSQANVHWEKSTGTSGRIVLWTGSAWPARPKVPAGEVTYRGPTSATNPTDALAGDFLELG